MDFEYISYNLALIIIHIIVLKQLLYKYKSKYTSITIIIGVQFILSMIFNYYDIYFMVKMLFISCIQTILTKYLVDVDTKTAIMTTLKYYLLVIVAEIICALFASHLIDYSKINGFELTDLLESYQSIFVQCVYISMHCFVCSIYFTIIAKFPFYTKIKYIVTLFFVGLIQIFILSILFFNYIDIYMHYKEYIGPLTYIISVFIYLNSTFSITTKSMLIQEQSEKRALEIQKQQSMQYYTLAMESYTNARKIKHDYKNQILTLQALMNKDPEDAKLFMENIVQTVDNPNILFSTGILMIDIILTLKYKQACDLSIPCTIDIVNIQDIHIQDIDLCNILNNVLDNAIYEAKSLPSNQNEIHATLKQQGDYLVINSSNPYQGKIQRYKNNFLSKKRNYMSAGFGLPIIEDIVKKYHGELHIDTNNNIFSITVLLINETL